MIRRLVPTAGRAIAAAGIALAPGAPLAAQQVELPPVAPRLARLVPPRPTPASFIADVPNVIPAPAQRDLDARIRAVQDSGWGDIGVAILRSIEGYQPYEVGVAIYRTWRIGRIDSIGSARRDLGALLLIVPKELTPDNRGHCWITTGLGAEAILTDGAAGTICRDRVVPHLLSRNHAAAVAAGIEAIAERVRADRLLASQPIAQPSARPRGPPQRVAGWRSRGMLVGEFLPLLVLVVGVGGLIFFLRWRRHHARSCPKCGRKMRRLSEEADDAALSRGQLFEEKLRSVDYDVWQCECGERRVIGWQRYFSGYSLCRRCGVHATRSERTVWRHATTASTGLAEVTYTCLACGDKRVEQETIPQLPDPTTAAASQSFSSGGGGGGGGGGGSSGGDFGGSGRTSGGGGGSSY